LRRLKYPPLSERRVQGWQGADVATMFPPLQHAKKEGRNSGPDYLRQQMLGMEAKMIFHKTGNKEVAMVITRLDTQRQREAHLAGDLL